MKQKLKQQLLSVIPLFITIIIFAILFSRIPTSEIIKVLRSINMAWFIFAIILSITANIFLSADKFRRIISKLACSFSFKRGLFIELGSYPLDKIFPLKSGQLTKMVYLKRQKNIPLRKGLGLVILDNASDLLALLFFVVLGFIISIFISSYSPHFYFLLSSIFVLIILLIFSVNSRFFLKIVKKINLRMYNHLKLLIRAIRKLHSKFFLALVLYSVFLFLLIFFDVYILFRAIGVVVPLWSVLIHMPLIILISLIPITLSGFGTRELAIIFFFSDYASYEV